MAATILHPTRANPFATASGNSFALSLFFPTSFAFKKTADKNFICARSLGLFILNVGAHARVRAAEIIHYFPHRVYSPLFSPYTPSRPPPFLLTSRNIICAICILINIVGGCIRFIHLIHIALRWVDLHSKENY